MTRPSPMKTRPPRKFTVIEGGAERSADAESIIPGVIVAFVDGLPGDNARVVIYRIGNQYFRKTILGDAKAALYNLERLMQIEENKWSNEKEIYRLRTLAEAER
jgi:hypothetical protein